MKRHPASAAPLYLWAGLAAGGNLIAAPAKFQVEALPVEDLLRVGRAQFAWLGAAEFLFAAIGVLICLSVTGWPRRLALLAIALFAAQQFGLRPALQARTDLIVHGQAVSPSNLHLWFIAAEIVKVGALILSGYAMVGCADPRRQP